MLGRVEVGEAWAYRARSQDTVGRVEVLRFGTKRPPRVLVRFLDEEFEGREEWVPPARLKTPWAEAEHWLAAERRWLAVLSASQAALRTVEHRAANMVLESMEPVEIVGLMDCHRHAVLTVGDRTAFAQLLGFDAADLAVDPGYVLEDGSVVAPWPALLEVVKRIAAIRADALLESLARDDAKAEREAVHGYWSRGVGAHLGRDLRRGRRRVQAGPRHGPPMVRRTGPRPVARAGRPARGGRPARPTGGDRDHRAARSRSWPPGGGNRA